jgi:hypothetical protein
MQSMHTMHQANTYAYVTKYTCEDQDMRTRSDHGVATGFGWSVYGEAKHIYHSNLGELKLLFLIHLLTETIYEYKYLKNDYIQQHSSLFWID